MECGHDNHLDWHLIIKCEVPLWLVQQEIWRKESPIIACVDPDRVDEEASPLVEGNVEIGDSQKTPVVYVK